MTVEQVYVGFGMNGNPITDLPDPVNPQDAATMAYVSQNAGGSPYYVPSTETFHVAVNRQVLFSHAITVDGALLVDGMLIGV